MIATKLFLVAAGSAIGGVVRWSVTLAAIKWLGPSFPFGTIAVNVIGSFVIGLFAGLAKHHAAFATEEFVLFAVVGVLGGFTTYSSFNEGTLALLREGRTAAAMLNLSLTGVVCLIFGLIGFALGNR